MNVVPDYDPRRVMASGETVYQARARLHKWGENDELRRQAMAQVADLMKRFRLSAEEAEDIVYVRRFGPDRFPSKGKAAEQVPSLRARLTAER